MRQLSNNLTILMKKRSTPIASEPYLCGRKARPPTYQTTLHSELRAVISKLQTMRQVTETAEVQQQSTLQSVPEWVQTPVHAETPPAQEDQVRNDADSEEHVDDGGSCYSRAIRRGSQICEEVNLSCETSRNVSRTYDYVGTAFT